MKKLLEICLSIFVGFATGTTVGAVGATKMLSKEITDEKVMSEKHLAMFLLMNQWVKRKQEGKNLSSFFEENGYKTIAVYGMSYVGETLVDELKETQIQVLYGIDKKAGRIYSDVKVCTMEEELEPVDVVVVTAITFFDEIEEMLSKKIECPIISIEDILYEI